MRSASVGPFHQFHDEIVGPDVEEGADVRMIQGRDGAGFALEALGELFSGNLDGDVAAQAGIARAVDFAHPAGSNGCENLIRPEADAGGQRHGETNFMILPQTNMRESAASGKQGTPMYCHSACL